jgi:hypothetical protein
VKKNCWEFLGCGAERMCNAYKDESLDGVNGGRNGGRACWTVKGTLCDDALGRTICRECRFYIHVREEEGPGFQLPHKPRD